MSAPAPENRRSRRDLLAPLGVLLVLSGIVVIVLAAITTLLVAPPGAFLVVSGIGLVVASEYRDEADVDYSRLGGLKVKVRGNAATTEGGEEGEDRSITRRRDKQPPCEAIEGQGKVDSNRHRRLARQPRGGCRLTQALNRRWDGKQ